MDWNDGHAYVVDPVTGRARLRQGSDPVELRSIEGVSKSKYMEWRFQFIDDALRTVAR